MNHPSEILSIGDVVPVKVLDIDRDRQRISLGLKQTQEDPWQRVVDTYNLGDELEGKVTKVVVVRRVRRDPRRRRGPRAHLRARQPPRREPARGRQPGRRHPREDPRDRLRAPPPVAVGQARRGPGAAAAGQHRRPGRCAEGRTTTRPRSARSATWGCPRTSSPTRPAEAEAPQTGGRRVRGRRRHRRPAEAQPRTQPATADEAETGEAPAAEAAEAEAPAAEERRGTGGRGARGSPPPRQSPKPPRPTSAEAPAAEADARRRRSRRTTSRPASSAVAGDGARVPFVGLTGGIAAGKSEALSALERLGAATLSTDAVVHELLASGEVRDLLVERSGTRSRPTARSTAAPWPSACSATTSAASGSRASSGRASGSGSTSGGRSSSSRDQPPPAAVVEVPLLFEAGMETGSTLRSRSSPRSRCARSARARAGTPGWRRAPRGSCPRRRRRNVRTSRCATTGRSGELEGKLSEVLARIDGVSSATANTPYGAYGARPRTRRVAPVRRRKLAILLATRPGHRRWPATWPRAARSRRSSREITLPLQHEDIIRQQARRQGPRPGADRGGDLPGVEVPRPDLGGRRARA